MAFLEELIGDKKVLISEDALDSLTITLQEVVQIYEEDLQRKPTILELENLIRMTLSYQPEQFASDIEGLEIRDIKIKVIKSKKKNSYKSGDIVAIPLNQGEIYAYGLIVQGTPKSADLYIEYYDLFTKNLLSLSEYKKREKTVLFTINSADDDIVTGVWRRIGSIPFDDKNYKVPDFYGTSAMDNSYYISKGTTNDPSARVKVTKEEAEKVKNPDGLWGSEAISELLFREYKKYSSY